MENPRDSALALARNPGSWHSMPVKGSKAGIANDTKRPGGSFGRLDGQNGPKIGAFRPENGLGFRGGFPLPKVLPGLVRVSLVCLEPKFYQGSFGFPLAKVLPYQDRGEFLWLMLLKGTNVHGALF